MKTKLMAFLGLALASSSVLAGEARFEKFHALELQALDARATILAQERSCVAAASAMAQLRVCRTQAQAAREGLGRELRPRYDALTHNRTVR